MRALDDTIVAISSASGGAARGIVRACGPLAQSWLREAFQPHGSAEWTSPRGPRAASGTLLLDGRFSSRLPCDAYFWPAPHSLAGQPTSEVHAIGSPPLLAAVVESCCRHGARLAEPGEFTMRAFLAGRLDLTQAEAVLGVIQAADDRSLGVALTQLAGGLATPLAHLRGELLDLVAELEAAFDFADEDIAFLRPGELPRRLATAAESLARLAHGLDSRDAAGPAVRVALAGRPSVGKTRLFNALSGGQGLVSPMPGTTRDYLTAELKLDGVACLLVDTAGIDASDPDDTTRHTPDDTAMSVEAAARNLAADQHRVAQVRLFCLDASQPLGPWEREALEAGGWIAVLTKADLPRRIDPPAGAIETSAHTGRGLDALRAAIRAAVVAAQAAGGDVVPATAARCRESFRLAGECLARAHALAAGMLAGALATSSVGEELVAAELRVALDELGKVAGVVYTEDILDRIFSRFCIGK